MASSLIEFTFGAITSGTVVQLPIDGITSVTIDLELSIQKSSMLQRI